MMSPQCSLFLLLSLVALSSVSLCEASGMRGASTSATTTKSTMETVKNILFADQQHDGDRQLQLSGNGLDCTNELSLDVVCRGECNFTARPLMCESKMFLYHGGSCRNTQVNNLSSLRAAAISTTGSDVSSDSAADCEDFQEGPPSEMGDEVFVVITDVYDTNKTASQTVQVGGYFWTDYEDFPTGAMGWSDTQNITFYRTNETTFDNMLQTMLFYAPCVDTPLELLAQDSSVQLAALAIDSKIQADFDFIIVSQNNNQQWNLISASVVLTVEPFYQGLPLTEDAQFDSTSPLEFPLMVELDPSNNETETLSILASATAITTDGLSQCTVTAVVNAPFV